MNRKSVIGIVFLSVLIVLAGFNSIPIDAQPIESNSTPVYLPEIVNDPDWDGEEFWYQQFNLKENMVGFYSNYTNMFHWFGDMGINAVTHIATTHHTFGYAYSPDGVNWNINRHFGRVSGMFDFDVRGEGRFDVVLEPNGRYFWIVSISEYHTEPYPIYGRRGELFLNGSIQWNNTIQTIVSGYIEVTKKPIDPIDAEISSDGTLFVSFNTYVGSVIYTGYVRWSDSTGGEWSTDGEQDYDSLLDWNKGDGYKEYLKLNRLAGGKMAWTGLFRDANPLWWAETVCFDGTNWLAGHQHRLFSSGVAEGNRHKTWDVVSYGDNLIGTYVSRSVGFQRVFVKEAVYHGPWGNSTELISDLPDASGVNVAHLTVDYDGNAIIFFYVHGEDVVNYTYRYANYTWQPNWTVLLNDSDADYYWNRFSFMDTTSKYYPLWFQDNTSSFTELGFHYLSWNESMLPIAFQHYNTTLYDEFGNSLNGEWLFEGDIYTFESYMMGASIYELNFTDGQHNIVLRFDNSTGNMYIVAGERFVIGEIYTNYTLYDDGTQKLLWRFIPDINIVDITNTTVDYYIYNAEFDISGSGYTGVSFNIYNLGGLTSYIFVGDGGRTPYGSTFDLHATDGNISSSATAEQIFRKLQHISFLVEINMGNEWDAGNGEFDIDAGVGYVDIGIDYRLNATWVDGFKIRLYVFSADVGHHLGGNDQDWVLWSVDFYNYLPGAGTQQNLQTAYIYSNHWGYERRNFSPDRYDNRTSSQLWIDLWFDKTNASTTIATQSNAYYRGMKEQGSAWWFGYGVFTPMIGDYDNAKFLDSLYDEGGNVTNVQKFDLMKFYITVGKVNDTDGNDEMWRISAVEDMHRELAIDRMGGIDEPTFVETKIIDMPQTGFVNAIKSAINGLSKLIWSGAFQFVKLLMGAVGALMEAIGLGDWWNAFNMILDRIATFSLQLMDELIISLTNTALLLTQVFNLVSTTIGKVVTVITSTVNNLLSWYGYMVDMIMGGGIFTTNFWTMLSLGDWALLFINLSPIWWINRLGNADNLGETLKSDIQFMAFIVTGLLNFLINIVMLSIALLSLLLGLLPI